MTIRQVSACREILDWVLLNQILVTRLDIELPPLTVYRSCAAKQAYRELFRRTWQA